MRVLLPGAQWAERLDAPVERSMAFVTPHPAERIIAPRRPAEPKAKAASDCAEGGTRPTRPGATGNASPGMRCLASASRAPPLPERQRGTTGSRCAMPRHRRSYPSSTWSLVVP